MTCFHRNLLTGIHCCGLPLYFVIDRPLALGVHVLISTLVPNSCTKDDRDRFDITARNLACRHSHRDTAKFGAVPGHIQLPLDQSAYQVQRQFPPGDTSTIESPVSRRNRRGDRYLRERVCQHLLVQARDANSFANSCRRHQLVQFPASHARRSAGHEKFDNFWVIRIEIFWSNLLKFHI